MTCDLCPVAYVLYLPPTNLVKSINCRDLKEEDILRMNINAYVKYRICESYFDAAKGALIISRLN